MASTLLKLVGNTPLAELARLSRPHKGVRMFAKLEMFNPSQSIKDRIVLHIVEDAEKRGRLRPGAALVEASSGNTAGALAMIGAVKGYRVIVAVPANASPVKIDMARAYGAEVVLCPAGQYIAKAKEIAAGLRGAFLLDQYRNPENVRAHYATTGPEIWEQMQGDVDYLISCASSGGTASGTGRYLKEKNPRLKLIVPDPVGSAYYDYFYTGKIKLASLKPYRTEGAGKQYICECMDFSLVDQVMRFTDEEAEASCAELAGEEGIWAGLSSGAVLHVARRLAATLKRPARMALIFPDSGMKYAHA